MIKIKKINISNFGPIKSFNKEMSNLEVFYGDNESGKTAIVDGIIRLLNLSVTSPFNREERRFSGNISIILDIDGKLIEISDDKKRNTLYDKLPILKKEPNILRFMIVRGGDLTLYPDKDNKRWWNSIKGFLADNQNLVNIRKRILEKARLTPELKVKLELKKRRDELEKLIKDIEDLKIEMDNLGNKERKLNEINKNISELKTDYAHLKRAEAYERYERALKNYNRHKSSLSKLMDYERYKDEYLKIWEEKESKLLNLKREEGEIDIRLDERIKEINNLKENLEREEKLIGEDKLLIKEIEDREILKKVVDLDKRMNHIGRIHPYTLTIFGLGILIGISGIIFSILKNPLWGIFISLLGGILIFLSGFIKNRMNNLKRDEREIKNSLSSLMIDAGDISAIPSTIDKKQIGIEEKERLKGNMEVEIDKKKEELERLERDKMEIGNRISTFNKDIDEIRSITGLPELKDLREKINEKKFIEKENKDTQDTLKGIFGSNDQDLWKDRIKDMALPEPNITPDPVRLKKIEIEIENKKIEKENIEGKIREIKDIKLKTLGFSSLKEAYEKGEELKKELREFQLKEDGGRLAIDVIDSISKDMDLIIGDILNGDRESVSQYFNSFTGGRYREVKIKNDSNGYDIYGVNFEGKELSANLLSSGTKDQLFLAFRIPFLKRMLGSPNFLLLDDAFLSSDYERRENLILSMKRLIEEGWQIIYFTMDRYTIEIFRDICGAEVNKIP